MKNKYKPFILTAIIILIDQLSKALVVAKIPENTILGEYLWGYLRIWHVRNDAIAFSVGASAPLLFKYAFFVVLPILVMGAVAYGIICKKCEEEFSVFQHWLLAGILGGGIGNIIDRVFRHLRVVDFISTKMYGAFGLEWFPTYNIADASVVICGILLLLSFILEMKGETK